MLSGALISSRPYLVTLSEAFLIRGRNKGSCGEALFHTLDQSCRYEEVFGDNQRRSAKICIEKYTVMPYLNHLIEVMQVRGHNTCICFFEKKILLLSSNTTDMVVLSCAFLDIFWTMWYKASYQDIAQAILSKKCDSVKLTSYS